MYMYMSLAWNANSRGMGAAMPISYLILAVFAGDGNISTLSTTEQNVEADSKLLSPIVAKEALPHLPRNAKFQRVTHCPALDRMIRLETTVSTVYRYIGRGPKSQRSGLLGEGNRLPQRLTFAMDAG